MKLVWPVNVTPGPLPPITGVINNDPSFSAKMINHLDLLKLILIYVIVAMWLLIEPPFTVKIVPFLKSKPTN